MSQRNVFERVVHWDLAWLAASAPGAASAVSAALIIPLFIPVAVHASTDVPRTVIEAQKAVRQAQQTALADKRERERAEHKAKRQQQEAERVARQQKARAQAEARQLAAKEAFAQKCANFQAWTAAGPIPAYPGSQASPAAIVTLLRADRFEPRFGKRYEDMSEAELRELSLLVGKCLQSKGPLSKMDPAERSLISQALTAFHQSAHNKYLADFDAADAVLLRLANEALALQPTRAGLDRWVSIATLAGLMFDRATSATREIFQENMKKADMAVAVPILPARIDEAMKNANGLEGLQALAKLAKMEFGPPPRSAMFLIGEEGRKVREESRRRLQERMGLIAAKVARTERARIERPQSVKQVICATTRSRWKNS